MSAAAEALSAEGVAIWLDGLSRARLDTFTLATMMTDQHGVGVTTNPLIFQPRSPAPTTMRPTSRR